MTTLIDRLTELTGLRDREAMDAALIGAVLTLMKGRSAALHRIVGDPGGERWLTAAQIQAGADAVVSDLSWIDLRQLPLLDTQPDWALCVRQDSELARPAGAPDSPATCTLIPVSGDQGVTGLVLIETDQPPPERAREEVRGLLRIYRNLLTLLDYSESDTLTGLLNRKSFDEAFYKASALPLNTLREGEVERRQGALQCYWLGVIDIDHFKQVNDQHGHLIGDEVLLLLARVMRKTFRFLDKLYRFGGEEFVVLLRCDSEEHALSAMERFRRNVEAHLFPRVQHITVSIGFTDVRSGDTPPAAVERADLAVYYAKHHGRNQVRSHAALVREGQLADAVQTSDVEFF